VQLNKLLDDYAAASRRAKGMTGSTEMEVIANRLQAAIDRLTVPTNSHAQAAVRARPGNLRCTVSWADRLASVATALREDIAAGWLTTTLTPGTSIWRRV
jgi:hypothetical protein